MAASKFKLTNNINLTSAHEDGFFCVLHREFLESKGFKWAPFHIAREFSIESPISFSEISELPFGFHGKKILRIFPIINLIQTFIKIINNAKKYFKNLKLSLFI